MSGYVLSIIDPTTGSTVEHFDAGHLLHDLQQLVDDMREAVTPAPEALISQ